MVKSKKCEICNKKLSLVQEMVGKCKCDKVFCNDHRFPKDHKCTFDHMKAAREELAKRNPVVKSDRLVRI